MIFGVDIKLMLAILTSIVWLIAFFPYLRDMFRGKTKPHAYTWLIWTITQGTAVAGLFYGKGGWGAVSLTVSAVMVLVTFLLSLKYGTRNITKSDTVILICALLAVVVWWQLHSPLAAVLMVSAIDFAGYFPSFRKTYEEPWTETPSAWVIFTIATLINIAALQAYNFLTLTYLIVISSANIVLLLICLLRRRVIPRSAPAVW